MIDHYLLFLRVHSEWLDQIKKITLKTYRDEGKLEVSVVGYQQEKGAVLFSHVLLLEYVLKYCREKHIFQENKLSWKTT